MKVFISYASEDKDLAEKLEKKLKTDGFIVYRDKSSLKGGDDWKKILIEKIQSCDYFILLWSSNSSRSLPVNKEILAALKYSKKICPCLIDEQPIFPILEHINYIKFQNFKDEDYSRLYKTFRIKIDADNNISEDILDAISTYKESVHEKFRKLRVLYENKEEPIEEAYVKLTFKPGIDFTISEDSIQLTKLVNENEKNLNIILGHPGTGKTSTLHYLMYTLSMENTQIIPLFAQLNRYDPNQTFKEFFNEKIYQHVLPGVRKVLNKYDLFKNYKIVVFLDGLDEVPAGRYENVLENLKEFYESHPQTKIFLTSRIDGFKGKRENDFLDWSKFTIAPLDIAKIKNLINIWFNDEEKERILINKIKSVPRLFDLANRPFLLALICLVFENEGDINPRRSSLYERASSYLIQSRLQNVSSEIVTMRSKILNQIGLRFLQMQKREFGQRILETMVSEILQENENLSHVKAKEFLEDLINETGIIQYYESNYQFIHLSFQEYYAANALHDIPDGKDILIDHCHVPGWEEPIRLYAGLVKDQKKQEDYVKEIWERHPALALRTASEAEYLASRFLMKLIQNSEKSERIRMLQEVESSIKSLSEADAKRIIIETISPLFNYEKDSAVLYFGIILLQKFDPKDEGGIMYEHFYKNSSDLFEMLISDTKYKFEFVKIPSGNFVMGDDTSNDINEKPAHFVEIDNFEFAKYQLTNLAYETIMGIDRSQRSNYSQKDDQPVVNINWYDAYICALKVGCRLPIEAEWEYAARAGSKGNWCFGDDEDKLIEYAHYYDIGASSARPVGLGLPNNWNLYDVHGNVWEWCQDWFGPYKNESQRNPKGSSSGEFRVRRGGGWLYHARGCRCAFRYGNDPYYCYNDIGIRLARDLGNNKKIEIINKS